MGVRAFGSWMSAPYCVFFQDFEGLTEAFGPGRPHKWPRDVRWISGPETSSLGCFVVPASDSFNMPLRNDIFYNTLTPPPILTFLETNPELSAEDSYNLGVAANFGPPTPPPPPPKHD